MAIKKMERKPLIQPGAATTTGTTPTVAPRIQPIERKPLIQPIQKTTVETNSNEGEEEMMNVNNGFENIDEEVNFDEVGAGMEYDTIDEFEQPTPTNFSRPAIQPTAPVQTKPVATQTVVPDITTETLEEEVKSIKAKPVARTKAAGGKKVTKTTNNPIKSTSPDDIVIPGQVTKREDLMKLALNHLRKMDMDMSIEAMSQVYKCLEKAIEDSVSRGGSVVFLGNQIQLKEKGQRVASVPNQNYDTLTFPYQAMQWSKLGERTTVRGKYDQDSKVFTCQDGTTYQL